VSGTTIQEIVRSASADAGQRVPTYDVAMIEAAFRQARDREPSISLLMLSTADGRAVAESSSLDTDGRRLAAMANSFLTLGETVARELALSQTDYATICTQAGNVVLIRIAAARPLTLTAVARQDTNMAVLLYVARDCAARLARELASAAN